MAITSVAKDMNSGKWRTVRQYVARAGLVLFGTFHCCPVQNCKYKMKNPNAISLRARNSGQQVFTFLSDVHVQKQNFSRQF